MHTTFHAQALAALPVSTGDELPADIQMFPPGEAVEFTLQNYPGERFTMKVDAAVAAKAQADLEKLAAAEQQGRGSAPFADKNHEDAEATFIPKKIYWAGDDLKNGGVRVQADWTPFGAALVKAKAFKYFSGNFLFNKQSKQFLGLINENIGGLVNRPGFASQQAFAKAADSSSRPGDLAALGAKYGLDVTSSPPDIHPFAALAEAAASKANVPPDDADLLIRLANWEPALFESYKTWCADQLFLNPRERLNILCVIARQNQQAGMLPADAWQKAVSEIPVHAAADGKGRADMLLAMAKATMQRTGMSFTHAWETAQRDIHAAAQATQQRSRQVSQQQPAPVALRLGRDKATAEKIAAKANVHQASGMKFDQAWALATGEVLAGK